MTSGRPSSPELGTRSWSHALETNESAFMQSYLSHSLAISITSSRLRVVGTAELRW